MSASTLARLKRAAERLIRRAFTDPKAPPAGEALAMVARLSRSLVKEGALTATEARTLDRHSKTVFWKVADSIPLSQHLRAADRQRAAKKKRRAKR